MSTPHHAPDAPEKMNNTAPAPGPPGQLRRVSHPPTEAATPPARPLSSPFPSFDNRIAQFAGRWQMMIALIVLIVYLAGYNTQWRFTPDSAAHVIIAKNLDAGLGYTHHADLQKFLNPGVALITAATFRITNSHQFWLINLVYIAIAIIAFVLLYRWLRFYLDRGSATIVTMLCALTEECYRFAFMVLTDMPFFLGLMLALLGYERFVRKTRGKMIVGLIMLLAGIAIMGLFRSVVIVFIAALSIVMFIRIIRGPRRALHACLFAFALIGYLALRLFDPRAAGPDGQVMVDDDRIIIERLFQQFSTTMSELWHTQLPLLFQEGISEAALALDFGPIASIPVSLFILVLALIATRKNPLGRAWLIMLLLQILLFLTVIRYMLPAIPFFALGWWWFACLLYRKAGPFHGRNLAVALLAVWIIMNTIRIGDFIAEQHHWRSSEGWPPHEQRLQAITPPPPPTPPTPHPTPSHTTPPLPPSPIPNTP